MENHFAKKALSGNGGTPSPPPLYGKSKKEGTFIFFLFFSFYLESIFTFLRGLNLDFSKVKIASALDIFFSIWKLQLHCQSYKLERRYETIVKLVKHLLNFAIRQ